LREPFEALSVVASARPLQAPVFAAPLAAPAPSRAGAYSAPAPQASRAPQPRSSRLASFLATPGVGLLATVAFFATVGFVGCKQNGEYSDFVAHNGRPVDLAARALGFSIDAVTISGLGELRESEVLAASGVGPADTLPFLDAEAVRERLMALPLVESARVFKFYPDRLLIAIEERRPFALWQRDGRLAVVAADGTVVDEVRDERFLGLPFVVGAGAEKRLGEYARLLEAAGDLKQRVRAGVLVSGRRWTLDMTNGVEVKLPEREPEAALAVLQKLQREARILDKDVVSVDLRAPGRVAARLGEDAAAARAAAKAHTVHKGART
jgi:cell division protein FtsQ